MKGKWNGEEAEITLGTVICGKSLRKTWWCADKEGERLDCVKVNYYDQEFFLYDGDKSGRRKVLFGQGSPTEYHASVPVDDPKTFQEVINA